MDSNSIKQSYFYRDLQKRTLCKECFHVFPDCSGSVIGAHSIQRQRILKKISYGGHVTMLFSRGLDFVIDKVGNKKATVFNGMCEIHDKKVFAPIEDFDYIENDVTQNGLFAYRCYIKELHAKTSCLRLYSAVLLYKSNLDINTQFIEKCREGCRLGLNDLLQYRELFKDVLSERDSDLLFTYLIIFDEEFGIAVSSAINFPYDFNGNRLQHLQEDLAIPSRSLFLTVFPQNGKTYVLISFFKKDLEFYSFLEAQLINQSTKKQKKLLTSLIIRNCENVVFSPICWDRLSKAKRDLVVSEYTPDNYFKDNQNELKDHLPFEIFWTL